jgi:hypothetical protein
LDPELTSDEADGVAGTVVEAPMMGGVGSLAMGRGRLVRKSILGRETGVASPIDIAELPPMKGPRPLIADAVEMERMEL